MPTTPSQTLEESFPLLETSTPTTTAEPDHGYGSGGTNESWSPLDQLVSGDTMQGGEVMGEAAPSMVESMPMLEGDDLTMIEGIGPKIAELFQSAGIDTFSTLASTPPDQIKEFLEDNGFGAHDPSTWPDQSQLAAAGAWDKLREWQAQLDGGRVLAEETAQPTTAVDEAVESDPPAGDQEPDDLTRIEGIGPKISELLVQVGIDTYRALSMTTPDQIREILSADPSLAMHDPSTWPDQSQLAAIGEWEQLREWQDQLDGGV